MPLEELSPCVSALNKAYLLYNFNELWSLSAYQFGEPARRSLFGCRISWGADILGAPGHLPGGAPLFICSLQEQTTTCAGCRKTVCLKCRFVIVLGLRRGAYKAYAWPGAAGKARRDVWRTA